MRVYLAPEVLEIDRVGYLPLDGLVSTISFQFGQRGTDDAASF